MTKLPSNVLNKIASFATADGIESLKKYIRACSELNSAAFSVEALFRLIVAKHSYALYIENVRLAFNVSEIDVALYILDDVKDVIPHAKLMYIMLCFYAGRECSDVYLEFQRKFRPKQAGLMDDSPECWEEHYWLKETNGERCAMCPYFYSSRDICIIS
ncbi:unnamed protein product [Arabis nemorensis]|uniref:Uncharacterized protein n=1 Tax=Arabis nemorensis TaxID=586526 RepID=A0A565BRR0_9BRAS|nr:unnamed protein product [Arabis nemorensis]